MVIDRIENSIMIGCKTKEGFLFDYQCFNKYINIKLIEI